ncbi:exopolysaccharide biosynthesis protein [Falsirhodobacter xinxiangensis]|uniref:exopolysaccharide biosynthesis protein n=1 Tax=Falsirhodobacter xinxiangensis TaxID=2530049 RepID=UPI0010AB47A5|nr:exopolysaccharide biosynthesis protein [Rhodobacter xinxiangensis]
MKDTITPEQSSPDAETSEEDRSHLPLSDLLDQFAAEVGERVSLSDLMLSFGSRATLALLLIFGILNILPNPPGSSAVLGLPMLYLSVALIRDRAPVFPRAILRRSLSGSVFSAIATRATPILRRFERIMHPRFEPLIEGFASRVTGALCLVLAFILVLPIPLGNIPPAACMCLLALAAIARDGVWVLIGWAASLLCIALLSGATIATIHFIAQFVLRLSA